MQPKVINPYSFIGTRHKEILDFIGANLPPDPTFEQLNEVLVNGSFDTDPDHPTISSFAGKFAGTILPNVYNGYVNTTIDGRPQTTVKAEAAFGSTMVSGQSSMVGANAIYNATQQAIIAQLFNGIRSVPAGEIGVFLENAEESIVTSGLTYEEQIPLFIAHTCARASNEYWENQMTTPGIWAVYMDANPAVSYMYLPGLVSATLQGALLSYGLMKKPEIALLDIYVSLMGATGLAAGKVVFGWMNP